MFQALLQVCIFLLPFLIYHQTSVPGFSFTVPLSKAKKASHDRLPLTYSSSATAAAAGLLANFLGEGHVASNARKELVGQAWARAAKGHLE